MFRKTDCQTRKLRILVLSLFLSTLVICTGGNTEAEIEIKDILTWRTIQDDDGTWESHWGKASTPNSMVCKIIKLETDPSQIKAARIKYEMATWPHHRATAKQYSGPQKGVEWADMVILVNDKIVVQKPGIELATKGWHEIPIKPELLKRGDNTIKFTWAKIPEGNPKGVSYGSFYIGIDTDNKLNRSYKSGDSGKTFQQGEYMVRLEIALSDK